MDIESIMRGYTDEQYSKALIITLGCYLDKIGVLKVHDLMKFYEENLSETLEQIKKEDLDNAKAAIEKYKKGLDGNNANTSN